MICPDYVPSVRWRGGHRMTVYAWAKRRSSGARYLTVMLVLGVIAELGTVLHIRGKAHFTLPWSKIAGLPGLSVERPQSNMVFADVEGDRAAGLVAHLRSRGVLAANGKRLRLVTHLDVDRAGIDRAVAAMAEYLND